MAANKLSLNNFNNFVNETKKLNILFKNDKPTINSEKDNKLILKFKKMDINKPTQFDFVKAELIVLFAELRLKHTAI